MKQQRKKLLMAGCLILAMAVSGCGKKEQTPEPVVSKEETGNSGYDAQKINWTLDENEDIGAYGFHEGRAWVTNEGGDHNLVDTKGDVVYTIPRSGDFIVSEHMRPIQDGVTYITGNIAGSDYSTTIIIDKDGNELRRLSSEDGNIYQIMGYGDGAFVVLNVRSDMNASGSYIFTIGTDGKDINEPRHIEGFDSNSGYLTNSDDSQSMYLGEDIFYFAGYNQDSFFYNLKNESIQHVPTALCRPLARFYDGRTLIEVPNAGVYVARQEDFTRDNSNLAFTEKYQTSDGQTEISCVVAGRVFSELSYVNSGDRGDVYDLDGKALGWTKGFEDYNYFAMTPFEDGYTAVTFEGADGKIYVTELDPKGRKLYDPVQVDMGIGDVPEYGQDGYLQVMHSGQLSFVYPDGSLHAWNENLKKMKNLTFGAVGDGFMLINCQETNYEGWDYMEEGHYKFISLDQKKSFTCQMTKKTKTFDSSKTDKTSDNQTQIEDDQTYKESMDGFLENTILYEKDGVTLRVVDEETIELKNANPDNKIADVLIEGIFYNGISFGNAGDLYVNATVQSGETEEINVGNTFLAYQEKMAGTSEELAELPIETITYLFKVRVGTSSESEYYTKTIQLPSYNEKDLDLLYGDKIKEYKIENVPYQGEMKEIDNENNNSEISYVDLEITAYRIQTKEGAAVLIQNNTDMDIYIAGLPRWIINGQTQNDGFSFDYDTIPKQASVVYKLDESIDSIRKRMEIGNDEAVRIQLGMKISTSVVGTGGEVIYVEAGSFR